MHIGVDLDNTLLDATTAYLSIYNRVSGLARTVGDLEKAHLWSLYGWTYEQYAEMYARHGDEIHRSSLPRLGALEVVHDWYRKWQVTIITARPAQFQDVTMAWLKKFEVPYHRIVFQVDKLAYCKAHDVDVLIDDGPHHAEQFALERWPFILMDQPYNQYVMGPFIYRAHNWQEVRDYVEMLNVEDREVESKG